MVVVRVEAQGVRTRIRKVGVETAHWEWIWRYFRHFIDKGNKTWRIMNMKARVREQEGGPGLGGR